MKTIAIGTITNTHGVKGAITVKTDSDFKTERYKIGNPLYILYKTTVIPVTLKGHFEKGTLDVLSFDEFSSINEVEKYKGCELHIDESSRQPLEEEDAYYYSDLIGLDVLTDHVIGSVKTVRAFPQGDMLIIAREGMKDVMIPFRKEFVSEVTATYVRVINTDGLL